MRISDKEQRLVMGGIGKRDVYNTYISITHKAHVGGSVEGKLHGHACGGVADGREYRVGKQARIEVVLDAQRAFGHVARTTHRIAERTRLVLGAWCVGVAELAERDL